jgi:hypothetical protein
MKLKTYIIIGSIVLCLGIISILARPSKNKHEDIVKDESHKVQLKDKDTLAQPATEIVAKTIIQPVADIEPQPVSIKSEVKPVAETEVKPVPLVPRKDKVKIAPKILPDDGIEPLKNMNDLTDEGVTPILLKDLADK